MELTHELRIILVEDNPDDAELTMRSLRDFRFISEIVWLKDGEEAIHYLKGIGKFVNRNFTVNPKLILLDLKIPKWNGLEVLEKIKNDEALKSIPVVMMTSSSEDSDIEKSYLLGANSYVVKPIDINKFTELVKEIGQYWLQCNESPLNKKLDK